MSLRVSEGIHNDTVLTTYALTGVDRPIQALITTGPVYSSESPLSQQLSKQFDPGLLHYPGRPHADHFFTFQKRGSSRL